MNQQNEYNGIRRVPMKTEAAGQELMAVLLPTWAKVYGLFRRLVGQAASLPAPSWQVSSLPHAWCFVGVVVWVGRRLLGRGGWPWLGRRVVS